MYIINGAGNVHIIWTFREGSLGWAILMFVIGGLTMLCGIALIANPLYASGVLPVLPAVYFFLDGIIEIAAGVLRRPEAGWRWLIFGGIVSVLLGNMIWSQFPLSGAWAMSILLGIKLFLIGLIMVAGGTVLRSIAKA